LKPEQWGSLLVQENNQEGKACDKRRIIIIIIISTRKKVCIKRQQPVLSGATGIVMKSVRKNLEAITGETFDKFTTEDSYTWNITHNTESTAV
jgi:hypothetical protein